MLPPNNAAAANLQGSVFLPSATRIPYTVGTPNTAPKIAASFHDVVCGLTIFSLKFFFKESIDHKL